MFEFLKDIWKYFHDREERIGTKISILTLVMSVLLIFELFTGFFTLLLNSQRIEFYNKITNALSTPNLDSRSKLYLLTAKAEIIKKGVIPIVGFQDLWRSFESLIISAGNSVNNAIAITNGAKPNNASISSERYIVYHIISSSIIWILLGILIVVLFFVRKDFTVRAIAGLIIFEGFILALVIGFSYLFSFNPISDFFIRFCTNMILQVAFLWSLISIYELFKNVINRSE